MFCIYFLYHNENAENDNRLLNHLFIQWKKLYFIFAIVVVAV